jgi:hypothetical protein
MHIDRANIGGLFPRPRRRSHRDARRDVFSRDARTTIRGLFCAPTSKAPILPGRQQGPLHHRIKHPDHVPWYVVALAGIAIKIHNHLAPNHIIANRITTDLRPPCRA